MPLQDIKTLSPIFYDKDDIVAEHDIKHWIKYYFDSFYISDSLRGWGPIYTLPTNLENIPQPKTHYKIKQNKPILLPTGKLVSYCKMDMFPMKREEMKDTVVNGMNAFSDFNIFLDNQLVSNECFRQMSDYFKVRGDKDTPARMAICDAYWLFIRPNTLTKGIHTINTYIACSMERTRISLYYNLEII